MFILFCFCFLFFIHPLVICPQSLLYSLCRPRRCYVFFLLRLVIQQNNCVSYVITRIVLYALVCMCLLRLCSNYALFADTFCPSSNGDLLSKSPNQGSVHPRKLFEYNISINVDICCPVLWTNFFLYHFNLKEWKGGEFVSWAQFLSVVDTYDLIQGSSIIILGGPHSKLRTFSLAIKLNL